MPDPAHCDLALWLPAPPFGYCTKLPNATSHDRSLAPIDPSAIAAAARALKHGELVLLPTETVYGVAASASSPAALAALDRLQTAAGHPRTQSTPRTWHAPSPQAVISACGISAPVHLRALDRLTPGPVRLLIPLEPTDLARALQSLGLTRGIIDESGELALRVPDHAMTRRVLEDAGVPIVMERVSALGLGSGRELPATFRDHPPAGVAHALDDGPTRYGRPSATVRLTAPGGYSILAEGAWDARTIDRRMERLVLFVCTGNTCRSPMAEAIARGLYARQERAKIPMRFLSAGVGATDGMAYSPETADAVRSVGHEMGPGRSRALTPELVRDAEVVYAMTRSHVRAVLELDPSALGRVFTIDPSGGDIQDPIGGPATVYRDTAERLSSLLAARLAELERGA